MTPLLSILPTSQIPNADRSGAPLTDERLMEMIQARRNDGLGLLHDRYSALLTAVSMAVLHNDADAADLLQEVFVEIWNRAPGYDPLKGRPLSWIVTMTRRRAIDRLRKRDAYGRLEERLTEATKGQTETWTHVHEDIVLGEMNKHLQRALAALPEAQRTAIELAYRGHMTQREIAAHTGIPLGTIKTRLELGLRKMAAFLHGFEDLLTTDRYSGETRNINAVITASR